MNKLYFLVVIFLTILSKTYTQPFVKSIAKLPDSGQTNDYTSIYGEDSDYLINAPSYTNNLDGTITDNITGLMWQSMDGGEMTYENAQKFVDSLTLAGFTNWRLPTALESYTLMNLNTNRPALDKTYFKATTAEYWWTSQAQYNDNSKIWVSNAGGGIGNHNKNETISAGGTKFFQTRAVRDVKNPITINERFIKDGSIITDQLTSLQWIFSDKDLIINWEDALQHAENFSYGQYADWRLPNIKELFTLHDVSKSNPACYPIFLPDMVTSKYWSSTTLSNQSGSAWYWDTRFGITTYTTKDQKLNIILVRNKLSTESRDLTDNKTNNSVVILNNYINLDNVYDSNSYCLINTNGQIMYEGKNIKDINFSFLVKGLYFLKIKNEFGIMSKRFIKF